MLKSLCEYITASGNLSDLVIGDTLHAGHIPDSAEHLCSCILERIGEKHNLYLLDQRRAPFQIFTRGASYFTARDEAQRIFEWLIAKENSTEIDIGDFVIHSIFGIAPAYIGQDEKFRYCFSANVTIVHKRKE
jgi:hypothetical protein